MSLRAHIWPLLLVLAADYRGEIRFNSLPLPGATVTITSAGRTLETATDAKGQFTFPNLSEGHSTLKAEKTGFATYTEEIEVTTPAPAIEMKMLPRDRIHSTAFQREASETSEPPATPATEITEELRQQAAEGFLINGSALNGAASAFATASIFGNARRGRRPLYTYALSLIDTNSILDAASYSITGQHTPKPPFNNMTGTVSFGGPLKIARLLPHNGPNLELNYSRVENRNTSVYTGLMPDASEIAAVPQRLISPQALALLKYYPQPNFPSAGYNYQVPLVANTHTDNLRAFVQKQVARRNNVSFLLGLQDTRSDSNSPFNFLDLKRQLGINATATYRRTFTSHFFGTLTYQYTRQSNSVIPFFANRANVSGEASITGNNQDPINWGPPTLQFNQSSIAGLTDATASVIHNQTSAASYASTWSHHEHNIEFGGDYRWQQFNTIAQSNPRGLFTFNGAATGSDFTDFLLGIPDASAIAFGNADKYLRATQPDLYFQDDWRVHSGITLLLGLRWEYTSPVSEKYGRLVNLAVAPGFTAITPVVGKDPLFQPYYKEFEPRLGLAWRPTTTSSLVIRAGYGISYNTQVYLPFANQMTQQSPLSTSLNIANTPANPLTLANGFSAPPNTTTNTIAVDPRFRPGYAQIWNLVAQRDLPDGIQLVATYTGTKGTHQLQAFAPNTYPTGPISPAGYVDYTSYANSTREAGTLQIRRRLHRGFAAQAQYTYSKSIDDASVLGGGTLGVVAQNWLGLAAERGPSSFDQRHVATFLLQYTSGMGIGGGTLLDGWRGTLFKDWSLLSSFNLATGLPLTPLYAQLCPGTGIPCGIRADYSGASVYTASPGYFLNPEAFAAPPAGAWGNAGRDSLTGPAQFSIGASMARAFRINDRFTLNLRIDSANPLNHVVVTQLNNVVTNPLFGLPIAVNPMRTVTTTLRLTF